MTSRKIAYWVIPPKENGAFVAAMENVLETYKKPYNEDFPVVCMDEQPIQLLDDVWEPIPETVSHPKRVDYEYKRCGTASIFMFTEPLNGWREVHVRPRRTKIDWAEEVKWLMEQYPQAEKIRLVCDNLNRSHLSFSVVWSVRPQVYEGNLGMEWKK